MDLEKFPDPMHPQAKHNYQVDWTDLLDGLSDTLTGTPTVVMDPDSETAPGLNITGVAIDGTSKKVQWNLDVDSGDWEDDAYKDGGVTVCFLVKADTVAGDDVVQQAQLVIHDQC